MVDVITPKEIKESESSDLKGRSHPSCATNTRRGYQMFTNTKFATWSLKPEILSGLEKSTDSATEIQRDTIPIALKD